MKRIASLITPSNISLSLDGRHRQLNSSHINFQAVRETLKKMGQASIAGDDALYALLVDDLRSFVDVPAFIARVTEGRVQVGDKEVRYNGKPIHGHFAERLIQLLSEGFDIRPWARLLDRLEHAPIYDAKDGFIHWLEKSGMPLTEDGCVTAYKFVNAHYKDQHTGRIDNRVGAVIPRIPVDGINTDRNQDCAASGYHFCSWNYTDLTSYPHVMIVKIAPEDIASFPNSEAAKGRCLFYEIVGEIPKEELGHRAIEQSPMYGVDRPAPDFGNAGTTYEADNGSENDDEEEDDGEDEAEGDTVDVADVDPPIRAYVASQGWTARSVSAREKWLARLGKTKVGGKKLTEARIKQMVDKYGQREVSRRTGIPRSTLQGNVK